MNQVLIVRIVIKTLLIHLAWLLMDHFRTRNDRVVGQWSLVKVMFLLVFSQIYLKLLYVNICFSILIEKELTDEEYGVSIFACKLVRNVEMYQWVEHESKRYVFILCHDHQFELLPIAGFAITNLQHMW